MEGRAEVLEEAVNALGNGREMDNGIIYLERQEVLVQPLTVGWHTVPPGGSKNVIRY